MAGQYEQANVPTTAHPEFSESSEPLPSPDHVKRGLRGAITNPNNSEEAKDRAREVLRDEFGETYEPLTKEERARVQAEKDPKHVAAGLLGAVHNERVSTEAKVKASETLLKSGVANPEDVDKGLVLE